MSSSGGRSFGPLPGCWARPQLGTALQNPLDVDGLEALSFFLQCGTSNQKQPPSAGPGGEKGDLEPWPKSRQFSPTCCAGAGSPCPTMFPDSRTRSIHVFALAPERICASFSSRAWSDMSRRLRLLLNALGPPTLIGAVTSHWSSPSGRAASPKTVSFTFFYSQARGNNGGFLNNQLLSNRYLFLPVLVRPQHQPVLASAATLALCPLCTILL
jgi:hypothetical protein